jgi:F-type H+-transporting ATPase subunit b
MATPTTGTHAPGGPPPFPPFVKEHFPSQLFWLALCFVVLYVLMAKVALPRVGAILEARRARIAADLAQAQRHKEESEAAMAAYEKALADARNRAQVIANETRDKLMGEADAVRKLLERGLNAKLEEAEQTIATTKRAAMANVRGVAVDAARAIVHRLIGVAPAEDVVARAVDRVLKP